MLSVCSARVRTVINQNEWIESVTVCIMMENISKDVVCVNVAGKRKYLPDGAMKLCDEIIFCSCDIMREHGVLCNYKCMHCNYVVGEQKFLNVVRERIVQGFSGNREDCCSSELHGT